MSVNFVKTVKITAILVPGGPVTLVTVPVSYLPAPTRPVPLGLPVSLRGGTSARNYGIPSRFDACKGTPSVAPLVRV